MGDGRAYGMLTFGNVARTIEADLDTQDTSLSFALLRQRIL